VTPHAQRVLVILSWWCAAAATFLAAYGLFALWAVNAEPLGKRDMGLGLFFAFSGAYALVACLWIAPTFAVLALASWLTRVGSALACLAAAAASALPLLILALRG
jgi:hypothetical protein